MASYHHGVKVVELLDGTRPIRTIETGIIGVVGTAPNADPNVFPLNEPVLIIGSRKKAAKLDTVGDGAGTLPQVMGAIFDQTSPVIVVVRVEEKADPVEQEAEIIGGVDSSGTYTGLEALRVAETKVGQRPRILGVPGFSHRIGVAKKIGSLAEQLRAFGYVDVVADSVEAATNYRDQFGNKRLMLMWPGVRVFDAASRSYINQPASARALGMRAKLDDQIGWHKTISNININGVVGMTQDVSWNLQESATDANTLNAKEVTTIAMRNGYRFWGSRTCSGDPKFAFESAVRTGDILADTIAEAHMWAIDKPMSQTLITDIIDGVNAKFGELRAKGYIVNAECYLDPELNSRESLESGQLHLNYDYSPVPPLELLGFNAQITNKYLVELLP